MILVKAAEIDFVLEAGNTIELPAGYGMAHDVDGEKLDKCSLFFGPVEVTKNEVENLPPEVSAYFGSLYVARRGVIDVPEGRWKSLGRVTEIVYYRPGRYEGDWKHAFSSPQPLYRQRAWLWLRLPNDCRVTWKGIERP